MSPTPVYQRIALGDITINNIGQLRKLNSVLFPIEYKASFYEEVLHVGEFAKLVYYNDVCVGSVCCRKEVAQDDQTNLYIMTLGVLKPYRRLGLGDQLLEHILKEASDKENKINKVYLHVQTNNDAAVAFYKKHGFEITRTDKDYYKEVEPRDAYVLEKLIV
ncbi:acyl-CoA N-acyltransferase [Halteromyces radiatus]|uniref:acyl-CoA N-acyltransferase n=1 Tax=Halteromyces radiatus TaxID=101107 RepID=UPI00221FC73E|nr:acyl-CoA N-acyltransferase [Halteromyces radiatus]KAI8084882.1 acyl-CoA N-acyltransferase [Halteromyces radiatus]